VLGNATITAFVATANPARSKRFYSDTLGLTVLSDDRFAIAFDCNGIQLRIQKVDKVRPHRFTSLGWHVANLRRAVAGLAKRGVTFERYPFLEQDEAGVWQAPSGSQVAWFKDPDGNLLSLTQGGT
jgi:catechol 2,3-dioxygenase-like lactoylglutathione lyase family enzyme